MQNGWPDRSANTYKGSSGSSVRSRTSSAPRASARSRCLCNSARFETVKSTCNCIGTSLWHWKYHTALAAHDDAEALRSRATARLASVLDAAQNALASIHVVNPSSHSRTEVVTAFVPESRIPTGMVLSVTDSRTGKTLAVEQSEQLNPDHRQAGRFLNVALEDVPSLGTVRLDLMPATDLTDRALARTDFQAAVLENDVMRVEVDLATASIRSIREEPTGAELVASDSTFGFNAYIYDRYASAGGINHQSSKLEASNNLAMLGSRTLARPAAVIDQGRSDVRQWLTYECVARGSELTYECVARGSEWVRATLTLQSGTGVLEIENRVSKAATMSKESAYFAFPFAATEPTIRIDASGAVTGNDIAQFPAAQNICRQSGAGSLFNRVAWGWRGSPRTLPLFSWVRSRSPTRLSHDLHRPSNRQRSTHGCTTTSGTLTSQPASVRNELPLPDRSHRGSQPRCRIGVRIPHRGGR